MKYQGKHCENRRKHFNNCILVIWSHTNFASRKKNIYLLCSKEIPILCLRTKNIYKEIRNTFFLNDLVNIFSVKNCKRFQIMENFL